MSRPALRMLRGVVVALLVGSALLQVVLPTLAGHLGGGYAQTAHLVRPYAALGIAAVGAVQVALVAAWWLLTWTLREDVGGRRALVCADVVTAGVALATLLAAAPTWHLLAVVGVGGPGVVLALGACLVGGAALTLAARAVRVRLGDLTGGRPDVAVV